jgi:tRNA pseudouridine65 synthase
MSLPPLVSSSDFIVETLEQPIQIVYEDPYFVAVFKPAGLMVHRGPNTMPEEPVLLQVLRDQLNRFLYPIHRLDRPTAGLILFALDSKTASKLGEMFMGHRIAKHYQALVRGFMPDEHTEHRPLVDRDATKRAIQKGSPSGSFAADREVSGNSDEPGQTATTHFRCLTRYEVPWQLGEFPSAQFSLLEVHPVTGRWHQIRRHLNHMSHPVIGDHRHGDHSWNQTFFEGTGEYRMMLTAMRLDFRHPFTDEWVTLWVPRGESFDAALQRLEPHRLP